ncbi:MBL fold metallo-hydrolase [Bacillus sp. JJ722]
MRDVNEKFNGRKLVAVILTHGHFDHVGSLAHILEI